VKTLFAVKAFPALRESDGSRPRATRYSLSFVAGLLALGGAYFAAAKLGLALAFQAEQVTAVWPPTGIALAAVLLFGYRMWPGIMVGALLANLTANESVLTACGISAGNTLEALAGAWLLRKFIGFRSLDRLKDVLGFVILAGGVSTMLSASIGVTSLCLGGIQPWAAYGSLWWLWWLGDAAGAVLVAPLILSWANQALLRPRRVSEAGALLGTLVLVSLVVFAGGVTAEISRHPLEYIIFPLIVWAALRFGQPGTTAVTFIASCIAIWGTVHGFGPFATGTMHQNLILLQTFMAVVAVTALLLSAAISERQGTEEVLRRNEELARHQFEEMEALYRMAPVGLSLVDTSLRYVRINQTLAVINGVPVEKTLGRTLHQVIPEIAPGIAPIYRQVIETGEPVLGFEIHGSTPREPGGERDWVVSYYPLKGIGSTVAGVGCIVQDVTDRKRAEQALRQSEASLRHRLDEMNTLLEILPTGVWIGNSDCSKITGNPAAYEMMGLPRGINASVTTDKPEMPSGLRIFANGVEVRPEDAPMQQVARSGKALRNIEHELVFPDGTRKAVYASIAPLFHADGKVRGVIGSYADFSERKQAEQALKEADQRKNEFLATLAHELRNPLAPISNALHLLRLSGNNPELQAEARGIMERQLGQMVRLIDDLLDVSRITRNKLKLRKERIELATAIQSALEATQPLIERLAHRLTVMLPPDPLYVHADPVRLAQVFTNLLNNAAKFTPRGGHIWFAADRQNANVLVSVRDTGIGIAGEHLPRLFALFSQVTPALERSQGGLGIGLSLVRGLVELHGGSVEARSEGLGRGSEFVVRLPVCSTAVQGPQKQEGECKLISSSCSRILVVEDNQDCAASLGRLLKQLGHDIRTALDGLEAVQIAETFQPQVVLLDIGLPKINGYDVARRIRQQPWGRNLLLIAMTGWGQEEDKRRAWEAGFDHHLVKPANLKTLLGLLETSSIR
jgi:PAS domain S-box-containing protein